MEPTNANGRKRTRVLLAEDYFAIAEIYCGLLGELGYEVVGPVSSVDRALAVLDEEEVHGAVLDVALRGKVVTPVAERLREMGRPFVFLTGLANLDLLPEHLIDTPTLEKPARPREIANALDRIGLAGEGAHGDR